MRRTMIAAAVLAVVVGTGCTSGTGFVDPTFDFSQIRRTAVVQVEGVVQSTIARQQIADYFGMELTAKGYRPIERLQIDAVLREQEFQASDLTRAEGVARAGQILNVDALVLINVDQHGEKTVLTAKLVMVEDASIPWYGEGYGRTGRTMAIVFGSMAGAGLGAAAGGEAGVAWAGAVAGGVLGGVAGDALAPDEVRIVRKIIRKTCESLPTNPAGLPQPRLGYDG